MSRVKLTFESWDSFWSSGGEALVQAEYDEHQDSLWKPLAPHHEMFQKMYDIGALHLLVARLLGLPIGFLITTVSSDLESRNSLMAQQGAFYVLPNHPELHVGKSLIETMLTKLRLLGVEEIELHHPVSGRGTRLSSLFARLGARACNSTYLLKLEKA